MADKIEKCGTRLGVMYNNAKTDDAKVEIEKMLTKGIIKYGEKFEDDFTVARGIGQSSCLDIRCEDKEKCDVYKKI